MPYIFRPAEARSSLVTLQEVIHTAVLQRKAIIKVAGNCMEGRDIIDGEHIAVDFTHYPRPGRWEDGKYLHGDPCLCYARFPEMEGEPPNSPIVMCKEYTGVWIGHMVGTCYKPAPGETFKMQTGFSAIAILGVVYASWGPEGELIWEHDPDTYPTKLPAKAAVKGGNIVPGKTLVKVRAEV